MAKDKKKVITRGQKREKAQKSKHVNNLTRIDLLEKRIEELENSKKK